MLRVKVKDKGTPIYDSIIITSLILSVSNTFFSSVYWAKNHGMVILLIFFYYPKLKLVHVK